jgi:phosphoribosylformylglycinamidine synthase
MPAGLTPAAAHRRRHRLLLIDLGRGAGPPRRLLPGAGVRRSATDAAGPGRSRCCRVVRAMQALNRARGRLLAYHDRSDGGLLVTLAGDGLRRALRPGDIDLADERRAMPAGRSCSAEELGAVSRCPPRRHAGARRMPARAGLGARTVRRPPGRDDGIRDASAGRAPVGPAAPLQGSGPRPATRMQRLRDNPDCADEEHRAHRGRRSRAQRVLSFDPARRRRALHRPPARGRAVAILREQGVNGQLEMAAAFDRAGFEAVDVHMSDISTGRRA